MASRKKGKKKIKLEVDPAVAQAQPEDEKPKKIKRAKPVDSAVYDLPPLGESVRQWGKKLHLQNVFWGLALLGIPALYFVWDKWGANFPMQESAEVSIKVVFAVAVTFLVLVRDVSFRERAGKAGTALALGAVLAAAIYFNLGTFHGHTQVHHWEQFHYALGAKYFPELGYDGLYAASIAAQLATYPDERPQPIIRDLRTNEVVPTEAPESVAHREEVKERFSPERWHAFVRDHRFFLDGNNRGYLFSIRKDHGFNPPPSWTFVARIFSTLPTFDARSTGTLANLDIVLLVALFVVVFRTYKSRLACLALILFGINYAGRYYWVGGAFLREDWLAAVVIGICMLEQKRYRWAGVLFGYATMVRIFPVLFLFGPGILALRALMRRELPRWAIDLGIGFVLAVVLGLGAGSLTGRGPAAWSDFAQAISLHKDTWLTNNVGLDTVLLYDETTFERKMVNFSQPEPWLQWQAMMDEKKQDNQVMLLLAKALLLLLTAAAVWRLDVPRAAMLGMVVVFTMVLTTCYYWQMLLIVPLLRSRFLVYGALALNLGLYALHFHTPAFEMRYGMMSWALLVLFVAYLAPMAWRNVRPAPEPITD